MGEMGEAEVRAKSISVSGEKVRTEWVSRLREKRGSR